MVNSRAKIKKTQKPSFSQASVDHQPSESASLIGSNDDLLTRILLRLPATSILRFKSVSKHWRLLLTDKHFTQRYVPFDVENSTTPPFSRLGFHCDPCGVRIVQSCNGLLLCRRHLGTNAAYNYYVFNPTTSQFILIPSVPGADDVRKTILFMGLAFHPTDCVHYKVICIRREKPGVTFQILMYSSDTGKWKVSLESFFTDWPYFSNVVYWNRALYWAPTPRNRLYFKINVEQLQTMPLPLEMISSLYTSYTRYFGESRGHLHLIVTNYPQENNLHLNVHEMLSDHSGWFVKYRAELDGLPGAFPEMVYRWDYRFNVSDVIRGEK